MGRDVAGIRLDGAPELNFRRRGEHHIRNCSGISTTGSCGV
jgi:hypothetical protein